eukprot:CAMPEP_0174753564 /NCGR_PEP_ID=MMETSP1094-20130205/104260_1 /TAXON_ID=156173 /ORGANISM="Chrysochromulina brevifilum, Strain UTEX LB 985" /LENGTH=89 /DNA_ID=CAMNT_0015959351 /DNA_START=1 /DNA_END=266 /DNA_ORIENTATION=+
MHAARLAIGLMAMQAPPSTLAQVVVADGFVRGFVLWLEQYVPSCHPLCRLWSECRRILNPAVRPEDGGVPSAVRALTQELGDLPPPPPP